jgi:hypothetical protein
MSRRSMSVKTVGLVLIGVLMAGCMALPKADRTMFQEPPLPSRGTLPLKAGMMTLVDARSPEDRQTLREIEDFPDRITLEMQMDLSEARLFRSIGHGLAGADVILRGQILQFSWKPRYNWVPFVPALGTLAAIGVPVSYSSGRVAIALEVLDARTNQPIASYVKAAVDEHPYWVYRYQDFTAGSDRDTDSAFRRVVEELATSILVDADRIVAAVKRPAGG